MCSDLQKVDFFVVVHLLPGRFLCLFAVLTAWAARLPRCLSCPSLSLFFLLLLLKQPGQVLAERRGSRIYMVFLRPSCPEHCAIIELRHLK